MKNNNKLTLRATFFRDLFDTDIDKTAEDTWKTFCEELFIHDVVKKKKDGLAFNGWTFSKNGKRGTDYAEEMDMLVLDFDGDVSIEQASKRYRSYEHLIYTSFRHKTKEKGGRDAFRVVFPLVKPISKEEFLKRKDCLAILARGADDIWSRPAQIYFLPTCTKENLPKSEVRRNKGSLVDLHELEIDRPRLNLKLDYEQATLSNGKRADIVHDLIANGWVHYKHWFNVGCSMYCNGFTEDDFVHATTVGMKISRDVAKAQVKWKECVKHCDRTGTEFNMGVIYNVLKGK